MSGNLSYRNFRQEMFSLAGYHTGLELVVDEAYMDETGIALHEKVHGTIFAETPDGWLHRSVLLCLKENTYPEKRNILTEINDFLFENTRLPHERAATFLGVIGLPKRDEMLKTRAMLNAEYSEYFKFFADFLPWLDSSFVSYVIAHSIVRFAFCSERLNKISDFNTLTVPNLQSVPGPKERLEIAKQVVVESELTAAEFIKALFHRLTEAHSIKPFDIFDDQAWETRLYSGGTEISTLERNAIELFEMLLAKLSGLKRNYQPQTPKCFEAVISSISRRRFHQEFPFVDGVPSYTEEAALYYAKEADRNAISRRKFISLPNFSLEASLNYLIEYMEQDLCVVFTQIKGQPEYFKMFSTVIYNGESNFLPGGGLTIDIHTIRNLAAYIGTNTFKQNLRSPFFYIVYAPDTPDAPILLPNFGEEEHVKLFMHHLAVNREPSAGQGLMIRPIVYGRPFWTYAIENAIGEHRDYSITVLNQDEDSKHEYWAHILVPEDISLFPGIAILDRSSRSAYNTYVEFRVEQGHLKSVIKDSLERGMSDVLQAVWETLPLV